MYPEDMRYYKMCKRNMNKIRPIIKGSDIKLTKKEIEFLQNPQGFVYNIIENAKKTAKPNPIASFLELWEHATGLVEKAKRHKSFFE